MIEKLRELLSRDQRLKDWEDAPVGWLFAQTALAGFGMVMCGFGIWFALVSSDLERTLWATGISVAAIAAETLSRWALRKEAKRDRDNTPNGS